MEFLGLAWVQWLLGVVAGLITLWVIPNKWWAKFISFFGAKLAPIMDKVASGVDAAGTLADGAGLKKAGVALHEGADIVDEAEDIPRLLAEYTKDGKLDAEEIKKLFVEFGEVGVEFKDFVFKVFKKSQ